jgi:hypothetical protein
MTEVHGQIESLKKVKARLYQEGIRRFNSLGEMRAFEHSYESERNEATQQITRELDKEIEGLRIIADKLQFDYLNLKKEKEDTINNELRLLHDKINSINDRQKPNIFLRFYYFMIVYILSIRRLKVEKSFGKKLYEATRNSKIAADDALREYQYHISNRKSILIERCSPRHEELARIKKVIEELNPLVAGAVGENLVVEELRMLPGKNILINDFSIDFVKPIYNRKEDDRIYSVQIDHLLITNAGVFVIETKNWSKKSVESPSLRSPVDQVRRTSYALFVILNGDSSHELDIQRHHWGERQLPIRVLLL